jgi:outer membrane protein assembly factor BamB
MRHKLLLVLGSILSLTIVGILPAGALAAEADPLDWNYWRGPEQNGISRQTGLIDDWDPNGGEGSNVLWMRADLGGRSTPVTMNGKLYTIVGEADPASKEILRVLQEKVVCVDAETGKTIWESKHNAYNTDVPDVRIGWSSVVADPDSGNVYAQGANGIFQCLNAETGKIVWQIPMSERFGLLTTYGGRTNFPIVHEDLVIIGGVIIGWGETAKPTFRMFGFNKNTGDQVWTAGTRPLPEDTTYSSPVIGVFNGQKLLVIGGGDGALWAFQPRTGKPVWHYDLSKRGLNTTPVIDGDTVYMGHSEENITGTTMGAMVAVDGTKSGDVTKTAELWKVDELGVGKSSPILVDGRLYCFTDAAKLQVLDAKTGEPIGRAIGLGTIMRSSPLYADGKIYAFEANGRWYILEPDAKAGAKIVKRGRLASGVEVNASPIVSHGKLYVQSSQALYCLADPDKKPGADAIPAPKNIEAPVADDQTPAWLQVSPCDVLLKPGEKQKFAVNLFNAHGQFLKAADNAAFELSGAGEIAADGTFMASAELKHQATQLTVKAGDLKGSARIRTVPPLPWAWDFEGVSDLPVTWVGMRYRHILRKLPDGNTVAVKITTIPKGTRSRGWLGHSDLSDYTIQADVLGAKVDDRMPDVGLSAQGYTFDMRGDKQELQLRLWDSQLDRFSKTINFSWEPNTWYTMKLQVANEDGKAVIRGKVWPRDEAEPEDWTIEAVDDLPTTQAAPGLYGNAGNAEIWLDNIKVYANK